MPRVRLTLNSIENTLLFCVDGIEKRPEYIQVMLSLQQYKQAFAALWELSVPEKERQPGRPTKYKCHGNSRVVMLSFCM